MQFLIEDARGRGVAAPLRKSDHLDEADRAVEADGEHVAGFHGMSRRGLAHSVDAHMPLLDKLGGAGAGLHDPRMPQELVEPLAIQIRG